MPARSSAGLIALAFIAFISLGLPDGLLGVAWPFMRADFGQPLDALGILLVSFTSGYLLSSFFSGAIVRTIGIGLLLAASVCATALALLGFTFIPVWWIIIPLSSLLGAGAGAIDAGLNNYVAANHSDGVMQWLHASFGVGVTLGPMIMTLGLTLGDTWRIGYWIVGGGQLVLALCFLLTARHWDRAAPPPEAETAAPANDATFRLTFGEPKAWLSMLLFFLYSGLELTVGFWAFSLLTEGRGIATERAGFWVSVYWAMFTVGRATAGLYARRLGVDNMVFIGLGLSLLAALLLWWSPHPGVGLAALGLAGLAFAPIFPAMVSGTRLRVSASHVSNTIGMQMAGAGLGAAALPALAGALAARTSLEVISPFLALVTLALMGLYSLIRWLPDRTAVT